MNTLEPSNTFVVRDYDTLKVIADPLRTQIVEMLLHAPMNVKQMARALALRVGLSVALFLLIMLGWAMGWVRPGGLPVGG